MFAVHTTLTAVTAYCSMLNIPKRTTPRSLLRPCIFARQRATVSNAPLVQRKSDRGRVYQVHMAGKRVITGRRFC